MKIQKANLPNKEGYFGSFGGRFVPETLMPLILELEKAYEEAREDIRFQKDFTDHLRDFANRPTGLYLASRLSDYLGGAKIYLKREDTLHTGAHKINNCIGQILLAKRMGKTRIIAETGAGQHGVATASVCAHFGLKCVVYMGAIDMKRQALNVHRMRFFGAEVRGVEGGQKTLKDAVNEAMRDWVSHVDDTYYLLGSALGPHPYPRMVRDFHRVIGEEVKAQILALEGRLPDEMVACVGGGSNAMGFFYEFLDQDKVRLIGVEAGGQGVEMLESHAARFSGGKWGVFQGCKTYVLQTPEGQIARTHSISAGLDYAAVGPEHAYYRDLGRIQYASATDEEVLKACQLLSELEGILPALESAHALAYAMNRAPEMRDDAILIVNLSGRGDKDMHEIMKFLDVTPK